MTPIYLDFDGVMNSLRTNLTRLPITTGFEGWSTQTTVDENGDTYHFTLSEQRNEAVHNLHNKAARIFWLTTWWSHPAPIVTATQVRGEVLRPLDPKNPDPDWKANVIRSRHDRREKFVWIDDDAIPNSFKNEYPNSYLVRPASGTGLCDWELDIIAHYVNH